MPESVADPEAVVAEAAEVVPLEAEVAGVMEMDEEVAAKVAGAEEEGVVVQISLILFKRYQSKFILGLKDCYYHCVH